MDTDQLLKNMGSKFAVGERAAKFALPEVKWNEDASTSAFVDVGKALFAMKGEEFQTNGYVCLDAAWAELNQEGKLGEFMEKLCETLYLTDKAQTASFINDYTPIISQWRDQYPKPFGDSKAYMGSIVVESVNIAEHLIRLGKLINKPDSEIQKWFEDAKLKSGRKEDLDVIAYMGEQCEKLGNKYLFLDGQFTLGNVFYANLKRKGDEKAKDNWTPKLNLDFYRLDKIKEQLVPTRTSTTMGINQLILLNTRLMKIDKETWRYTKPMNDGVIILCGEIIAEGSYWNIKGFKDLWN